MPGEVTQMGPGISLWWALLSLAVGVAIVVLIAVRVWRETRERREKKGAEEGEAESDAGQ